MDVRVRVKVAQVEFEVKCWLPANQAHEVSVVSRSGYISRFQSKRSLWLSMANGRLFHRNYDLCEGKRKRLAINAPSHGMQSTLPTTSFNNSVHKEHTTCYPYQFLNLSRACLLGKATPLFRPKTTGHNRLPKLSVSRHI